MKNRHVRFTATAHEHVRREKAWWLANRDHPDVFTEELEQALQIIAAIALLRTDVAKDTVAEPDAQRRRPVITRRGIRDHDPWNG